MLTVWQFWPTSKSDLVAKGSVHPFKKWCAKWSPNAIRLSKMISQKESVRSCNVNVYGVLRIKCQDSLRVKSRSRPLKSSNPLMSIFHDFHINLWILKTAEGKHAPQDAFLSFLMDSVKEFLDVCFGMFFTRFIYSMAIIGWLIELIV